MRVRGIVLLVVVFLIAADEPSKQAMTDRDKLQGEWTMVSMEVRGKKRSNEDVRLFKLTIKDDRWAQTYGESEPTATTFKIDPSKDPKVLDRTIGSMKVLSPGIYKLEGDTLTLCHATGSGERPKEFKTTSEAGTLIVWKRAKK